MLLLVTLDLGGRLRAKFRHEMSDSLTLCARDALLYTCLSRWWLITAMKMHSISQRGSFVNNGDLITCNATTSTFSIFMIGPQTVNICSINNFITGTTQYPWLSAKAQNQSRVKRKLWRRVITLFYWGLKGPFIFITNHLLGLLTGINVCDPC